MNNYYGTDAVVLASRERGEADLRLDVFTKDLGRLSVMATGVRLAKSKLRGHITLFSLLRLMLARGTASWRLIDAEAVSQSYTDVMYQKPCADFILRLVGEEEPDFDMWDLVSEMHSVASSADEARFRLRALAVAGFLPDELARRRFFTPRACAFIAGGGDDMLFADSEEVEAFEEGVEGILRANHMLY
jgi:DNA repair protein RecO (recombination protein O)